MYDQDNQSQSNKMVQLIITYSKIIISSNGIQKYPKVRALSQVMIGLSGIFGRGVPVGYLVVVRVVRLKLGLYRICFCEIRPEPDFAGFVKQI